ncbi:MULTISPECIES: DUF4345 family protein [Pseudomonas]|uniref:DUF4345 family protein n=2 Tax=Pseudomonas TaxID=286 RepID=A0A2X2C9C9_PSELU|nr:MULTISPECIES: DUF4345 family protein [Pseudomonas]AYN93867.1 DUF4345 domain-containing protein [Pseudomonas sp. LTJR-52]ENA36829.1 hypothetical protein HMPREF1487_05009 [Pseudomonas sp. HPB0071]MBA1247110.1 DUF4345 domain-containing protein [Pseudomonas zeshuii]MBF8640179.1 DUF4345 family protein [Pseudomonas zeshuii]MBH3437904.1 DUF4345 family protein [Pseudomonas luteola]
MFYTRFARAVLIVQTLVWAGLALAYWFRPYEMTNASGVLLMDSASVTETQVFYGGLQFGLALFTGFAVFRPQLVRAALLLIVFLQLSTASVRLIGALLADAGEANFDWYSQLYKIVIAILAIVALRLLDRWNRMLDERYGDYEDD